MDIEQKNALVEATRRHAAQDMLARGSYGRLNAFGFRGCSIGCLAYEIDPIGRPLNNHGLVAERYGYPEWLARLQDTLFENASEDVHVGLAEALRPGTDWQQLYHAISRRVLTEVALPNAGEARSAVSAVAELHETRSADVAAWAAARNLALLYRSHSGFADDRLPRLLAAAEKLGTPFPDPESVEPADLVALVERLQEQGGEKHQGNDPRNQQVLQAAH